MNLTLVKGIQTGYRDRMKNNKNIQYIIAIMEMIALTLILTDPMRVVKNGDALTIPLYSLTLVLGPIWIFIVPRTHFLWKFALLGQFLVFGWFQEIISLLVRDEYSTFSTPEENWFVILLVLPVIMSYTMLGLSNAGAETSR